MISYHLWKWKKMQHKDREEQSPSMAQQRTEHSWKNKWSILNYCFHFFSLVLFFHRRQCKIWAQHWRWRQEQWSQQSCPWSLKPKAWSLGGSSSMAGLLSLSSWPPKTPKTSQEKKPWGTFSPWQKHWPKSAGLHSTTSSTLMFWWQMVSSSPSAQLVRPGERAGNGWKLILNVKNVFGWCWMMLDNAGWCWRVLLKRSLKTFWDRV